MMQVQWKSAQTLDTLVHYERKLGRVGKRSNDHERLSVRGGYSLRSNLALSSVEDQVATEIALDVDRLVSL